MKQSAIRYLYLTGGWFAFALGIIGLLLPLVPTTPFLIVTAFCFSRGSTRLHGWLLRQPWIGPAVRDWERAGVIRPRAKIAATILLAISASYPTFFLSIPMWAKGAMLTTITAVLVFIWGRPSRPGLARTDSRRERDTND